jgi:hypothetical protein
MRACTGILVGFGLAALPAGIRAQQSGTTPATTTRATTTSTKPAAPGDVAFAGVAWGDATTAVQGKLEAAGFTSFSGADQDVPVYRGELVGIQALVLPSFTAGRTLNLLTVLVKAGPDSSRAAYERIVQVVSGKYGGPNSVVREYSAPYAEGDGRAAEGITLGKIRLSTSWALRNELIVVSIGRGHDVVVSYQPTGTQQAGANPF